MPIMTILRFLVSCVSGIGLWLQVETSHAQTLISLPKLAASRTETSVSGVSSGAYMAGQYQFAFGASVVGAGIIAGGPYGCAQVRYGSFMPPVTRLLMNASQSLNGCMATTLSWSGIPDAAFLAEQARDLAAEQRIDPITNINRHKVYLFSGSNDQTVAHAVVVAAAEVYLRLGVPKEHIKPGLR